MFFQVLVFDSPFELENKSSTSISHTSHQNARHINHETKKMSMNFITSLQCFKQGALIQPINPYESFYILRKCCWIGMQ